MAQSRDLENASVIWGSVYHPELRFRQYSQDYCILRYTVPGRVTIHSDELRSDLGASSANLAPKSTGGDIQAL